MFDFDPDDYDAGREDARYERGDTYRYRYDCGDATCGASDCGSCRNGDPEEADDEPEQADEEADAEAEPEAGDRVTEQNVADLPVGTVVAWQMLGEEWTAVKRGPDEWHVPASSLPAPYADAGVVHGEPAHIVSIPAEEKP
jgi:hypothetical protein